MIVESVHLQLVIWVLKNILMDGVSDLILQ